MLGVTKTVFLAAGIVAVYMALSVVAQFRHNGQVCELPVVVEVLNGCGQSGVAEKVASHLRGCGFDACLNEPVDEAGLWTEQATAIRRRRWPPHWGGPRWYIR